MALLSDAAAFYTWAATAWAFTASAVVAIARCWARGRDLRVEDVFTGFRAPLVLVAALLSQVSLRLRREHPRGTRGGVRACSARLPPAPFLSHLACPRICAGFCVVTLVRSPW